MTAVRRSVVGIADACERGDLGFDPDRFECMMTLTSESPTLRAGSLEHAQKKQRILTLAVADRMGADPETDLRPHVVASTVISTFRAAADAFGNGRMPYKTLSEAVDAAFAILEEGINLPSEGAGSTEE
jgi:hypothetical protein